MLNKEQLQLFNAFEIANNKIHGHPMTVSEKKEYEKRVSMLCKNRYYYIKSLFHKIHSKIFKTITDKVIKRKNKGTTNITEALCFILLCNVRKMPDDIYLRAEYSAMKSKLNEKLRTLNVE